MSCCGSREKLADVRAEQKWDYINLSDFKSSSCFAGFSYGVLYIALIISIAVYGVDIFTASNLLFFDRWSGQVKPAIPFTISRWIFAGCILLSWILLVYRWFKAVRAIKSGIVAASYLDPLAVRVQSVRMGSNGRGWRRFLVFTALTKGRKGAEYVALFTYFSFEAWLRIVFAEGPRQVINALTLYSVMQAKLLPDGQHAAKKGHSPAIQFFVNVSILANSDKQQAAILFGMLFTLVVWVISALSLVIAVLMYIMFLWHHIPSADGDLSNYCRRKIDSRLHKIVGVKVNRALERDNDFIAKEEAKAVGSGERPAQIKRQPTVPILDFQGVIKVQEVPPLSRQTTQATLPPYTSRPPPTPNSASRGLPTVPDVFADPYRPTPPSRSATSNSGWSDGSYASNAPLLGAASDVGYGNPGSTYPGAAPVRMGSDLRTHSERPPMGRSGTTSSQGTQRSYNTTYMPNPRSAQNDPSNFLRGPPPRQNTDPGKFAPSGRSTPTAYPPPPGHSTPAPCPLSSGRSTPAPAPFPTQCRKPTLHQNLPLESIGRRTPTPITHRQPPVQEYEMRTQPSTPASNPTSSPNNGSGGYVAFNPSLHALKSTNNIPTATPIRNINASSSSCPAPPQADYFGLKPLPQRSGTAPIPQAATYDDSIYDSYGADNGNEDPQRPAMMPGRAATASPGVWNGQNRGQGRF